MAKLADLQAKAEELGIPTEKEGKKLTIAELEAAIEEVNTPESNQETPEALVDESQHSPNPPEGDIEEPSEEKEEVVKTSKVPREKTFAEKVADAVPKLAAFVNGRATEKQAKELLKELVGE
jgi:hypothetical protein